MKILIVDDHNLVRHGLAMVVAANFEDAEVFEAGSVDEAVAILKEHTPEIALIDVRLTSDDDDRNGLDLLKIVRAGYPSIPVLMLTSYDQANYAREAMGTGAAGYLLKDSSPADLTQAIRVALSGGSNIVSTKVIAKLFDDPPEPARSGRGISGPNEDVHITEREIQILELVIAGESNRDIAAALTLSDKTVKSHLATLYRKLDVANRTQAAMAALALGVVAPVGRGVGAAVAPSRE